MRKLPEAGVGVLRYAGVSESGIASVGNLSLVGAQPVLLSLDQKNKANKLETAYQEMLKMLPSAGDASSAK